MKLQIDVCYDFRTLFGYKNSERIEIGRFYFDYVEDKYYFEQHNYDIKLHAKELKLIAKYIKTIDW